MDINLFYLAGIAVIALILLIVFRPKNNALHRNLRPGVTITMLVSLLIIFLACIVLFGERIVRNGVDELYTDYAEIAAYTNSSIDNDTISITINVDTISINNKEYTDIEEIKPILSEILNNEKKVHIIDDYALARTYENLITTLDDMGIKKEDITEEKIY